LAHDRGAAAIQSENEHSSVSANDEIAPPCAYNRSSFAIRISPELDSLPQNIRKRQLRLPRRHGRLRWLLRLAARALTAP
jgi:hypothetical protein